jgi:hypothetical protein
MFKTLLRLIAFCIAVLTRIALAASPNVPFDRPLLYSSAFVAKLSNTGTLLYSTYLGGAGGEVDGYGIAVDHLGYVYVGGDTMTGFFPDAPAITVNPSAGFLVKFRPKLETLEFAIYLGAAIENIAILETSANNNSNSAPSPTKIYTTGYRYPPDTDTTKVSNQDAFVVMLSDTP